MNLQNMDDILSMSVRLAFNPSDEAEAHRRMSQMLVLRMTPIAKQNRKQSESIRLSAGVICSLIHHTHQTSRGRETYHYTIVYLDYLTL